MQVFIFIFSRGRPKQSVSEAHQRYLGFPGDRRVLAPHARLEVAQLLVGQLQAGPHQRGQQVAVGRPPEPRAYRADVHAHERRDVEAPLQGRVRGQALAQVGRVLDVVEDPLGHLWGGWPGRGAVQQRWVRCPPTLGQAAWPPPLQPYTFGRPPRERGNRGGACQDDQGLEYNKTATNTGMQ